VDRATGPKRLWFAMVLFQSVGGETVPEPANGTGLSRFVGASGAVPGEGWVVYAKCTDIPRTTFFPHDRVGIMVAKRVCASCPVRGQCLEYALENRIAHGVWGGASEQERRRMLRHRR
jgi:WhiB family redox-sensing transcriptional regulator